MNSIYADPAVRQRLAEFLGGDTLEHATALFLTHPDGVGFEKRDMRPPAELDWFLERNLDVARSLADSASILLHLDVEYVNFDSPAEAYLDPWRSFDLQEPVARVIESLLVGWGIRPLHIITGQGHHFVWRVSWESPVAERIVELAPAPEIVEGCQARLPPFLFKTIQPMAQRAFAGLSLIFQHVAQRVKELAAPRCAIPVEITAVHVGPGVTSRREIVSVDISEYGDPLQTRTIRAPFTNYLKPWVAGVAQKVASGAIPACRAIPLHEMDVRQAITLRQVDREVRDLARRACIKIPEESEGTERLLDSYLVSRLRHFHEYFYACQHDPPERWEETYGHTPLETLPHCARHVLTFPNDLLLKPAGMQLVTRALLARQWHPRHIAGLIRSKFENPSFNWGVDWKGYDAAARADFYTCVFAGLHATGVDRMVDFNCVSTREKGFCFPDPNGCAGLESHRQQLLASQPS